MNVAFGSDIYNLIIHFGVYGITDTTIPVSVMCDRANMAVRTIKNDLRRKVAYFDDEIMNSSIAEHEIISGFEAALEDGQIRMYLQPLTDKEGVPFGAEALARWVRPDGSVMPPAGFIDTLERAGLISELDRYIWEQAARQLSSWKGTDKEHLSISVNMSAKDFYHMDVFGTLKEIADKYDIECSSIRLEITETALIENPESSDAAIRKLQEAGFIVEIDDFGKGQSSLSLLKDIRADVLKIDRGFLLETENVSRSKIILQAVVSMAKELGMRIITEGIETERQLKALTAMGCDGFQGYYFSKPLSVEEFESRY
jgi:EAL domain-containing protein (putative c-di-GMP-specific phosphodiesterase class I)